MVCRVNPMSMSPLLHFRCEASSLVSCYPLAAFCMSLGVIVLGEALHIEKAIPYPE